MNVESLLAELECILVLDEKRQNPFNDTGPRGHPHAVGGANIPGHKPTRRGNLEPDGWDCHCVSYDCTCKGRGKHSGQTKHFTVDRSYKHNYNSKYVGKYGSWKKSKGGTSGRGAFRRAKVA